MFSSLPVLQQVGLLATTPDQESIQTQGNIPHILHLKYALLKQSSELFYSKIQVSQKWKRYKQLTQWASGYSGNTSVV